MSMTFDEMEQKLAYIGKAAEGAVLRKASLDGAKVLAVRMQAATPVVKTGSMRASVGFRGMRARANSGAAKAGFNVGKKGLDIKKDGTKTNVGRHGHLFVLGTDHRYRGFVRDRGFGKTKFAVKRTKNGIRYTGRMPSALPSFIRLAATSAQSEVMTTVSASIQQGIEKAINKQGL